MPDWRAGDVIRLTVVDSLSENKEKQWTGLCFSQKQVKNLRARAAINMNVDGIGIVMKYPLWSPLLKNFEIVKYGSNKLRRKMNHIPALDLSKGRLEEPIIKGRGYKARSGSKASNQGVRKSSKKRLKDYMYQM